MVGSWLLRHIRGDTLLLYRKIFDLKEGDENMWGKANKRIIAGSCWDSRRRDTTPTTSLRKDIRFISE